jgi:hypothetical protein
MDATISKNKYTNNYEVKKWDKNYNVVERFHTKKKHLAHEKFSQFFRETYNK